MARRTPESHSKRDRHDSDHEQRAGQGEWTPPSGDPDVETQCEGSSEKRHAERRVGFHRGGAGDDGFQRLDPERPTEKCEDAEAEAENGPDPGQGPKVANEGIVRTNAQGFMRSAYTKKLPAGVVTILNPIGPSPSMRRIT